MDPDRVLNARCDCSSQESIQGRSFGFSQVGPALCLVTGRPACRNGSQKKALADFGKHSESFRRTACGKRKPDRSFEYVFVVMVSSSSRRNVLCRQLVDSFHRKVSTGESPSSSACITVNFGETPYECLKDKRSRLRELRNRQSLNITGTGLRVIASVTLARLALIRSSQWFCQFVHESIADRCECDKPEIAVLGKRSSNGRGSVQCPCAAEPA